MRRVPVLALLLFGCTKNGGEGMVILGNTAPSGGACLLTGEATQPTFSGGQIFAGAPTGYILTPLIQSLITPDGSGEEADRNIILEGADVTVTNAASGQQLDQFTSVFTGSVPPGGTVNVSFTVIPAADINMFKSTAGQTQLLADIVVYGTLGGGKIEAEPFDYGVAVGSDLVVDDVGNCKGLTATVSTGDPCNVWQDGIVDCCESGSGSAVSLVCPAVAE